MKALRSKKGFTLVEIMIVVAIIGLLAAIAIPNFVNARTTARNKACQANLKQIEGAIQVWAIDNNIAGTAAVTWGDIVPDYLKRMPECPSGGTYGITTVDADPTCSIGGEHVLQ